VKPSQHILRLHKSYEDVQMVLDKSYSYYNYNYELIQQYECDTFHWDKQFIKVVVCR